MIKGDRVITSTDEKLIGEMRNAMGVVSGISSEHITISVDRSASEVVRRVAGVTLTDGFISIRGMTPRYNPVFLNNASCHRPILINGHLTLICYHHRLLTALWFTNRPRRNFCRFRRWCGKGLH